MPLFKETMDSTMTLASAIGHREDTTTSVATASTQSQVSTSLTEADCDKLRQDIHGFVTQLERIILSVDSSEAGDQSDGCLSSDQPTLLEIIRTALHEIAEFLETPLGKNASVLVNQYSNRIGLLGLAVNFTQVTAGVVVVNLFLEIANKLLKVKEDDFRLARLRIEKSLEFIREKLPEIKQGVHDAGEVFKKIRETPGKDDVELRKRLYKFKEIIKTTKLNIKHCNDMLESAGVQIEEAMRRIAVHVWLNGAARGAILVMGAGGIYYLCKTNVITKATGAAIGIFGTVMLFVRIRPQYQKEKEDFLEYKITQDDLKRRLAFLSDHLKGHEDACVEYQHEAKK